MHLLFHLLLIPTKWCTDTDFLHEVLRCYYLFKAVGLHIGISGNWKQISVLKTNKMSTSQMKCQTWTYHMDISYLHVSLCEGCYWIFFVIIFLAFEESFPHYNIVYSWLYFVYLVHIPVNSLYTSITRRNHNLKLHIFRREDPGKEHLSFLLVFCVAKRRE